MTPIWMANAYAHFDMTEDELVEEGTRFARPDVEPFEPVAHYPGTATLMLITRWLKTLLAIYGAIHAGRAAMVWLLEVM